MLAHLYIDGFRLWRDTKVPFRAGVPTALIGPNASGKSTILEVLDFLAVAATRGLNEAAYERHAGPADFFHPEHRRLTLGVMLDPPPADGGPVYYQLTLRRERSVLSIEGERIEIYKRGLGTRPLRVMERNHGKCRIRNVSTREMEEVHADPAELLFQAVRQDAHYPTLRHVREALGRIRVYPGFSTAPLWSLERQARDSSPRGSVVIRHQGALDPRGRHLTNALYTLQQSDAHRWSYLLQQLQQEFPFCQRLTFPADLGGSKVSLAWTDARFEGTRTADQMSSGMWSFLCLLAALFAADPPHLLAFDEPDNHLHPSMMRRLISLLEEVSTDTTVVFTTHGGRVLDELGAPAESLWVCEVTEQGASLNSLDEEAFQAWLEVYDRPSVMRRAGLLDGENG